MNEAAMKSVCHKAYADWMGTVTLTQEEVAMMGPAPIEAAMRDIAKDNYHVSDEDINTHSEVIDGMALMYYELLLEVMQCQE